MPGDFNVKSEEWFASHTDRKGALPSEFVIAKGLIAMNNNTKTTHFHREFGSHIDVTFASESPARQIKDWAVLNEESKYDHNYICFTVDRWTIVVAHKKAGRRAINKLDPHRLGEVILASEWDKDLMPTGISVEMAAQKLICTVTAAYNRTMP